MHQPRSLFPIMKRIILPVFSIILFCSTLRAQQDSCLHFEIETSNGGKGDTVCVRILVKNFTDILSFQFPINYDPKVVKPIGVNSLNNNLVGFDDQLSINVDTVKQHVVRVIWTDPNDQKNTLSDGSVLLIVCFKLIGSPGECSKIFLSNRPISTEFVRRIPRAPFANDTSICFVEDNPDDLICIGIPDSLSVSSSTCGTTTNTGSITIKAWGGREPYFVSCPTTLPATNGVIQKPGDCLIVGNQSAGSYTFNIKDALGKDITITVVVNTNSSIDVRKDITNILDPTCWYSANGKLGVTAIGGGGPLFIKWLPLNIYGVNRVSGLTAGKYSVVVTDSFGCSQSLDLELRADSLKGNLTIDRAASCQNLCDGRAIIRASGGTPCLGKRYEFIWKNKSSADCVIDTVCTNDSLCGNQFVIIRDCKKCEDTVFFQIPYGGNLQTAISTDSVLCFGDATGRIKVTASSAAGLKFPITFDLRDLTNTTIAGGLTNGADYISSQIIAGTYILRTTDSLGCDHLDTIKVFQPSKLDLLENQISTSESCNPGADAVLDIRGIGGTQPYKYKWSNGDSTNRISSLTQGTYTVTITDANNCTITKSYTITKPVGPKITGFNNTNINCPGDTTGCVEVLFTPGSTPVSIMWNIPGNTARICGLRDGTYTVTLTDQSGCMDTATTHIITATNPIVVDSFVILHPSCPGKSDGLIIVFAKGGSGQLTYNWSNIGNGPVNSSLKAGQYIVDIDDIGGCSALKDTFTLVDRPKPAILISNIIDPSCSETASCDASSWVNVSTTDTIVVVTWSSGEQNRYIGHSGSFQDTARNLCSGPQYVVISVNDLCSDTVFFNINTPPRISLDSPLLKLVRPSCFGRSDGSISIAAKGGCMPYLFEWQNPTTLGPVLSNIPDGFYKVKITDCRGCVHFDSVRLRQPDTIRVQIIPGSTYDVSCPGQKDGRITLVWNGGSGGKAQFNWSPNVGTDSVLTQLASGIYTVTVTDNNNCTGTATIQIQEPQALSFILSPIDTPKCSEDQFDFSVLQVFGGLGPAYRYTINNGAPNAVGDVVPLFSGSYNITIYDKNGCSKDTVIVIPDPKNDLSLEFGKDFDTIRLGDSIRLLGVINSQSPIVSYTWDPAHLVSNINSSDSYVRPGSNTIFMLTITDENGCTASDKISIIVESIRHFYAPNIMSPNGDNTNDLLEFAVGADVEEVEFVEVFDRWGGKVYSIQKPDIQSGAVRTWNGSFHGDPVNPGVYVYQAKVRFRDGYTLVYRGDITVVR